MCYDVLVLLSSRHLLLNCTMWPSQMSASDMDTMHFVFRAFPAMHVSFTLCTACITPCMCCVVLQVPWYAVLGNHDHGKLCRELQV
jgi:hypothetical protein